MTYVRRIISDKILEVQKYYPVTAVTGPRQSGKTSLCRHLFPDYKYVNLEDLTQRARAIDDPVSFLQSLGEKAIIDEVQNVPEVMSMIQVRVDEDPSLRYILTGSTNFTLLNRMTQSLAGRVAMFTLLPFSFKEMTAEEKAIDTPLLMQRGQYPGILINGIPTDIFYSNYYTTYVERDIRDLLKIKNIMQFNSFVRLTASRVGTEYNVSQIAKEVGVSSPTIKEWLSLLHTSYIVFTLRPYYANISKQLTKMPKIYFYDTGLLCYLLGIDSDERYNTSQLKGNIFENMAVSELIKGEYNSARTPRFSYYRERSGREIDVVMETKGELRLYEIKAGSTYKTDYSVNMKYLAERVGERATMTVVYDGESYPPSPLNIREV